MSRLSKGLHWIDKIISTVMLALFGSLRWQPPTWATGLWRTFTSLSLGGIKRVNRWAHARPRAALATFLLVGLAAGCTGYGYTWWQAQPKPMEVVFRVLPPSSEPRYKEDGSLHIDALRVEFSRSIAPLAAVGKVLPAGSSPGSAPYMRLSPSIPGQWRWSTEKTLEFLPNEAWGIGMSYEGEFDSELTPKNLRLKERSFKFSSAAFGAKIVSAQFYQDPTDPALKKAVMTLRFTHPVDSADLEKRIAMQLQSSEKNSFLEGGKENIKWQISYDRFKREAYLHSVPLQIPKETTSLKITIEAGIQPLAKGNPTEKPLSQTIKIPGLNSLSVENVESVVATNERYEPEHVLTINMSETTYEKEMNKAVQAWILPLYPPGTKKEDRTEAYVWSELEQITPEVLRQATPLKLAPIPTESEHVELHSFKYSADVGRSLYIKVNKGVKSFGGYLLGDTSHHLLQVPAFPAELKILSQGSLLAMSGEKKVAVLLRDLPGVKFEIGRVLPGQLQHLVSQSRGNFSDPQFMGQLNAENLTERFERKIPLNLKAGRAHYEAIDLGEYLKGDEKKGVFLLNIQGYDPKADAKQQEAAKNAEPQRPAEDEETAEPAEGEPQESESDAMDSSEKSDRRLVVVTDLGLVLKRSLDGTLDAYVQSIQSGNPVAGVLVEVIAKNGLTIASAKTDEFGAAKLPKIDGFSREKAPLVLTAKKGNDFSFMPLNRRDRNLDMSRFDVGGIQNAISADDLNAYLFSDRGIYRPGDTMRIGMIVKAADWRKNLAGLPLIAEVLDARGLKVKQELVKLTVGGFVEISHTTQDTSPTGVYTINLSLAKDAASGQAGKAIGSTTVKLQEFLPDRMKAVARLSSQVEDGWVHPKDLKAQVNVQNLFGTPAEKRKLEATLTLSPAYPSFRTWPAYSFYDPLRAKEAYSANLPDQYTDEKGEAEFNLNLEKYARATYRAHVLIRAFEPEGGRSVSAETASLVSTLPYLIGFKTDGDLNYVNRGAKRTIDLIAINPQAKRIAQDKLKLQLVEIKFISVLTKQENGIYKYESKKREVLIQENAFAIATQGTPLTLNSETPGNFAYVIRDAEGLELNRISYSVSGKGNVTRSLERNVELQLTLNKKDYNPGEEIEVSIRAPYTGAGLITIERDKVFAHTWFKADTLASVQKIRLPANFEGNGYVNVQFVRDIASDEIFTSPMSYGAVPFATALTARTNPLKLTAPAIVKPGEKLNLKLSSKLPSRAVVVAVDEGILQVARYQNPDPLAHFFQKRALEVKTSQILDLILPEFKKLMTASAPGGDEESALGKHLNPFKRKREQAVAYWSGIVDVNGEKEFTYTVPEYFNGSLRLYAVAVNDSSVGIAKAATTVRGDFVLLPNIPSMVAPGDQFEVSVGISNNAIGSGKDAKVRLALATGAGLQVDGPTEQVIPVAEMREGVALFKLKTLPKLGSTPLNFTATLEGQPNRKARLTYETSVRPASPYTAQINMGHFTGNTELPVTRDLHEEYRKLEVAASPVPLVLANGLSAYLDSFSHACTEQIVSKALPAVVLAQQPEFLKNTDASSHRQSLEQLISVLRSRQNGEGGLGLWSAGVKADDYATVYAAHFLLEAREHNQAIPADLLRATNAYLERIAAKPANSLFELRTRAYATYVLTRQGQLPSPALTALLTALRERLETTYAKEMPQDAAGAFLAASYQLLKDEKTANQLIAPLTQQMIKAARPQFVYDSYYDPLIRDTQVLYLLSKHFPARAKNIGSDTLQSMLAPLSKQTFNTHSAAWIILALDAYAINISGQAAGKLTISEIDQQGKATALQLPGNLVQRGPFSPQASKLKLSTESSSPIFYAISETGFDKSPPKTELKAGMEILREYLSTEGKPATSAKLGEELTVVLKFRAIDRAAINNAVIVDLLPGGFEPVINTAVNTQNGATPSRILSGGNWRAENSDVREDRVVFYGNFTNSISEIRYRIKATNTGNFTVPPAFAESLYDRTLQARSTSSGLTVVR
ncbi:MAG: alpha-2-macroglobulin family protein [Burkholderiaceae bacterium]|nr:alpha-2-macroglobulin family protein [Burkholderiaceae bacterium]